VVEDLHALLARAGLRPPYVLGGWSIGGFDVRYYQQRYPAEVAGLVLVDGTPPAFLLESAEPLVGAFETMYTHAAATELQPPPSLGSLPLVDVIRGVGLDDFWLAAHKQIARTSTNSILVRANGASHAIPQDNPRLIAAALKLVLGVVRRGEPLPACLNEHYRGTCLDAGAS
jgi:pimeloyl-ACP methyl ester carboxylesterase